MATVELQVEQWQERGIQVMVLLSFTLQLVLLILAEFRRHIDSGALRAVIWSAYMLAHSTAIYTLGHLSVTSRSENHELMAFWAPFLLLHLGGQDNITAYAIEDNRLWLRHLHALAVQVAAAAYLLYESTVVGTQVLLRNAAVLVFVLGVVKYGERVWALKRANTSASGNKYRSFDGRTRSLNGPPTYQRDTEGLLRIAHLLLDVPKDLLQGPLPRVAVYLDRDDYFIPAKDLYKVVEMQLSLMHDVMYSKAEVIHTWYGVCIRVISPVFTAVAFVLFHRSGLSAGQHHYSRGDIVITYILLCGAVILEMVSVLRAMFSRWPSVVLRKLAYDAVGVERCMWGLLARAIASIRRFILPERHRSRWWWSNSMRQQNLIDLCVRSRASRASRIASWMGVEDWWNTLLYSRSISVSTTIKELVVKHVRTSQSCSNEYYFTMSTQEGPDHIINSRGRAALQKWGVYNILSRFVHMELDESILVWHIATDIYLHWRKNQGQAAADHVCHLVEASRLAEAIGEISNYMVFLLAARPYMLPGSVGRTRYVDMCYCLTGLKYSTTQDLASLLTSSSQSTSAEDGYCGLKNIVQRRGDIVDCIRGNKTLAAAHELARKLVSLRSDIPTELEMIAQVWTEMLCYAGYRCSGYSHAKQLGNGGELLTVAALVVYYRRDILKPLSKAEEDRRKGGQQSLGLLVTSRARQGLLVTLRPRQTSSCNLLGMNICPPLALALFGFLLMKRGTPGMCPPMRYPMSELSPLMRYLRLPLTLPRN